MGILSKVLGGASAAPIEALGKVFDGLFTSDEEKLDKKVLMQRLAMQPQLAQVELNKLEAQSRFWFAANWRPFIGWCCGLGVLNTFLINPYIQWITGADGPALPVDTMMQLTLGMLGLLGTMRTVEKLKGRAK